MFRSLGSLIALVWRILKLASAGPGRLANFALLAAVVVLALIGIRVSVYLIRWTNDFYNALQKLDVPAVLDQLVLFAGLTAVSASLYLAGTYLKQRLLIRWRAALSGALTTRWLAEKTYWFLDPVHGGEGVDNPDQRIAEDSRLFFEILLEQVLEFGISLVGLVTFVTLLWQLSTFPLAFTMLGVDIAIPRYMVWLAPIYVAMSTALTHWLGHPLTGLYAEQQKREADFRFALVRLRESGDAVALHGGERAERGILDSRFSEVVRVWNAVIRRELILGTFTRPYFQTVLRIPMFLALPAFLAGQVTLGGLMQLASAFQNVVTTLSFFLFRYKKLAEFAATAKRLGAFLDAMDRVRAAPAGVARIAADRDRLTIAGLRVKTPGGAILLEVDDLILKRGEHVWLRGASGLGKSTLIKALAGLWPHAEGEVGLPAGRVMFLPQQVYLPLGGLDCAACYPEPAGAVAHAAVRDALHQVGLGARADASPANVEGLGRERQRVALARVLAARPDWVFLDETTSALDSVAEQRLMAMLQKHLPETTFIVIAHRAPQGFASLRSVELGRQAVTDAA